MSDITGVLIVKEDTKEYGSNGFRKRGFVIKTDEQYPQEIPIEVIQDKCDLLNNYNEGDNIKVSYNLKGRSWTNPQGEVKYFGTVQAWRIESIAQSPVQEQPPVDQYKPTSGIGDEDDDEMLF